MSDQFGRHKSNRWVNASVPSYGDDWGDEYDYDDAYESDPDSRQKQKPPTPQRFELPEDSTPNSDSSNGYSHPLPTEQLHQIQSQANSGNVDHNPYQSSNAANSYSANSSNSNAANATAHAAKSSSSSLDPGIRQLPAPSDLVLSIDKFKNAPTSDSDDLDDDDDSGFPEVVEDIHDASRKSSAGTELGYGPDDPVVHTVTKVAHIYDKNGDADLAPPTPTYSVSQGGFAGPETPQSDSSFRSDADSIQHEPESLTLADSSQFFSRSRDILGAETSTEKPLRKDTLKRVPPESDNLPSAYESPSLDANHSRSSLDPKSKSPGPSPAPLVLSIDTKNFNVDDGSSDEDDWGYNSQHSSNADLVLEDASESNNDSNSNFSFKYSSARATPQLQQKEIGKTETIDSLIKDLEVATVDSSSKKDERGLLPKLDSIHDFDIPDFQDVSFSKYDDFEDEVTTPIAPLSIDEAKKGHEEYVSELNVRKKSIRKPPETRKNLVSEDYSNIADAVSGYINGDVESNNNNMEVIGELTVAEEDQEFSPEQPLKLTELRPVASTGSLSTGRISIDNSSQLGDGNPVARDDNDNEKEDISRRISTMSTGTLNMGGWKPNTNNFRDQFINDNDNESFNFDPIKQDENFKKFTKVRTVSEISTGSNGSTTSIPDTIDAELPRIDEDDDNNDDTTTDEPVQALEGTNSNFTTDTVLLEHPHSTLFKEETLTPGASRDNLGKAEDQRQKYNSLITQDPETGVDRRIASDDTYINDNTSKEDAKKNESELSSIEPKKTVSTPLSHPAVPHNYPVFDWKKIMSISQPQDRIAALKDALQKESDYDTGLQTWLQEALKQSQVSSNIHIGRIASEAYQNATHSEIRRHTSIRSRVSIVKDKVEGTGLLASSLGKKFFSKGRKLMKSSE